MMKNIFYYIPCDCGSQSLHVLNFLVLQSSKVGCACGEGKCDPSHCEHVKMFDHDNDHARDKSGLPMEGRFPYNEEGKIILEVGHKHSAQMYNNYLIYVKVAEIILKIL